MSRRRAATSLAAGLALLVAAPLVWWATQPDPAGQRVSSVNASAAADLAAPASAPDLAPAAPAAPAAAPAPATTTTTAPAPTTTTATTAKTTQPLVQAVANSPATPVRIELPALGVDTVVVPVGVDGEGRMEVPEDVGTVGWYRFGPTPGATAGSAVLTGHVDDYRQGLGVFARIGDLGPGDIVRVVDEAGVTREFEVLSREEWPKGGVPLDRLFDRGGSARLVLITCGGTFNNTTLGYDDNIAITAVPVTP